MFGSLLRIVRSLKQLSSPEMLRDLGRRRQHLQLIEKLRLLGSGCRISEDILIQDYAPHRLVMGDGSSIGAGTVLSFGSSGEGYGCIEIGSRSWLGQYNNLRASGDANVVVGSDCLISQFCTLVAAGHGTAQGQPVAAQSMQSDRRGIVLGNDVWLGAGTVILPGVCVGDGAIIGANAVVSHDVPTNEIWAGVPARKIGERK